MKTGRPRAGKTPPPASPSRSQRGGGVRRGALGQRRAIRPRRAHGHAHEHDPHDRGNDHRFQRLQTYGHGQITIRGYRRRRFGRRAHLRAPSTSQAHAIAGTECSPESASSRPRATVGGKSAFTRPSLNLFVIATRSVLGTPAAPRRKRPAREPNSNPACGFGESPPGRRRPDSRSKKLLSPQFLGHG